MSLVYQVESQFLRRCGIMSALNIFSYTKGLWNLLEVNLNNLNRNIPYIHHKIRDSISVSSMPGDMICWIEIHLVQKSIYYILILYNSWKCRNKKLLWAQYILKFIFDLLGSLINIKKSILTPTSTLEFFG